jgi:hypothetical protein
VALGVPGLAIVAPSAACSFRDCTGDIEYPDRTLAFIRYQSGPVLGGDLTAVKEFQRSFL